MSNTHSTQELTLHPPPPHPTPPHPTPPQVNFSICGDEFWEILANVKQDPTTFMQEGGTLAVGQSMTREQSDELFEAMDMDQTGLLSLKQVRGCFRRLQDYLPHMFSGLRFWESINVENEKLLVSPVSFHYIMENLSLNVPKSVRAESKQHITEHRQARRYLPRDRAGDLILAVTTGACDALFTMLDWDSESYLALDEIQTRLPTLVEEGVSVGTLALR